MPVVTRATLLREPDDHVTFPEAISLAGAMAYLVDDTNPVLKPLWEGDPTLGWEGDRRLRVYICPHRGTWELVRYERGSYIAVTRCAEGVGLSVPDLVGRWLIWLVNHDGRRGFDPVAAIDAHDAQREAAHEAELTDKLANDVEPRVAHALRRDGVDEVWGGHWSLANLRKVGPTSPVKQVEDE